MLRFFLCFFLKRKMSNKFKNYVRSGIRCNLAMMKVRTPQKRGDSSESVSHEFFVLAISHKAKTMPLCLYNKCKEENKRYWLWGHLPIF
ncbi:hypothetical protein HMPREF0083_03271 [Aneurinibacillus aneurinilyticus ATCC 12856]|uniref:Uncharacterized protein n=1 Tax=Aneurinibacillus aneurinilyticus ATCC 12856 TaxID=649747 RepID=U1YD31_ANEAE|nr:hypothetical protein HMPREF0083_03271 [Aneurinibacillus aneurinilyticus ATCC 12856]